MKRWLDPEEVAVPADVQRFVGGHPLVVRTLVRRGITSVSRAEAFLDPDRYSPAPAGDLPNLERAAERVEAAIRRGERICVWGDFDVDGQTSTTLLVSTLRDLGADVTYHIPVRATESHGIKVPFLDQEIEAGAQLILTCDTGVAAHEAIAHANARGVDVVVTDHHELPPELPDAAAIVNPHLLPAGHPLAALPGVGVAYKLAEELYRRAGRPAAAARHLDLVALGIVADVAGLAGDNRYLLQRGLGQLRETRRLGLVELMKVAGLQPARLNEEHIGFGLGPRLNALGRLDDANPIVEFFTTEDLTRARILASQLDALNARRKLLCEQVFDAALAQIEEDPSLLDYAVLVLANPAWPAGIIGIVASRLVERFNRPVVLLSTPPGKLGRGSARSIEGCHITEAFATQRALLEGFGGHAMAAGLGIAPEKIPAFRRGLSRAVAAQLGVGERVAELQIDGYLPLADLSLDLVEDLDRLAPFGPGHPALVLASRDLVVKTHRTLGRSGTHLLVTVEDAEGVEQQVVWWQWNGAALPRGRFDLAYTVRANDYRGQRYLQIVWEDVRQVEAAVVMVEPEAPTLEIVDYRRELHPLTLLTPLLSRDDVRIWREGPGATEIPGGHRLELEPAPALAIWSAPPGPEVLQAILERVQPERVYLFGVPPELREFEPFLQHLGGLIKYALRARGGELHLPLVAALTGHREATVREGVEWFAAKGYVAVVEESPEELRLTSGSGAPREDLLAVAARLHVLLDESAAYRHHGARADAEALLTSFL